ncbi:lactoylglutathione lyase-like lyase [Caulobacter sp. AP07]|uniref:VOC family protein n=1 Tax=Caulobacter sp. AP07 TaxID=1144304 RepID=UPI0002720C57|nr:VOC family protein [Caulobacter sp. AP07]EJL27332.1 lactoylglutathione lyase-like lyase [Caulobacter sp. AP07]
MKINGLSHVAYRCVNAAETVKFYTELLGLRYSYAVAENKVPSTGAVYPHIHIFLENGDGSYLGFFELADGEPMGFDPNTPSWVQHLAFRVDSEAEVEAYRQKLKAAGLDVLGVTDHAIFKSIYFHDPSGHRIEITCETMSDETRAQFEANAQALLAEWDRTKRAPDVSWHRAHTVSS